MQRNYVEHVKELNAAQLAAKTIQDLLAVLDDDWYATVEGEYHVPTWGPETESVRSQIAASCADGDIVSWDTRDADPAKHLYLRRRWTPHRPDGNEQWFYLTTGAEYDDE
jgi:hypothetical protein